MAERRVRLVFELEATIVDDAWTDDDLRDNAFIYMQSIVDRAEDKRRQTNAFAAASGEDTDDAYWLNVDDPSLYYADDYLLEVVDARGLEVIRDLEPAQRRDLAWAVYRAKETE